MTYVIAEPCVDLKDKACIEECPVDCIYEGKRSLYIHPDECVDCGACEPVCPVEAIFYEDDTPAQWKDYYRANVDFFTETTKIGSPGGASKVGPVDVDHPVILAVPLGKNTEGHESCARDGPPARLSRSSPGTSSRPMPTKREVPPVALSTCRSGRPSTRRPSSSRTR